MIQKLFQGSPSAFVAYSESGRVPVYVDEFWTAMQRAAHPLHEISYRACYKPQLPAYFLEHYGEPGQTVFDPFLGRGTTLIEAQLRGFRVAGSDINPLCLRLAAPRLAKVEGTAVRERLSAVQLDRQALEREDLLAFFHPDTLGEIEAWRRYFAMRRAAGTFDVLDGWTEMVAANRLTGHSPGFFSVYSMPPNQAVTVERQWIINARLRQEPAARDTKAIILKKTRSLLKAPLPKEYGSQPAHLFVASADALGPQPGSSVDLVITSPPFLNVVDYESDNWMRMWFCGCAVEPGALWNLRSMAAWGDAMGRTFRELRRIVRPGGVIAFEVGEVKKGKVRLEEEISRLGFAEGLIPEAIYINSQHFTKTANCWGVGNNAAGTNTNRIVILRKAD